MKGFMQWFKSSNKMKRWIVMTLIDYVKKEIYRKFNKKIEVEIEMIGD